LRNVPFGRDRGQPAGRTPADHEHQRPPSRRPGRQRVLQPALIGLIVGLLTVLGWHYVASRTPATIPGVPASAKQVAIGQLLTEVNGDLTAGQQVQLVVYPDRLVATMPGAVIWAPKYDSTPIWDLVPQARVLTGQLAVDEERSPPSGGLAQVAAISGAIVSVIAMVAFGAFLVFLTWYLARSMPRTGVNKRKRTPRTAQFADVAGLEAVREDLEEVVRFLRDPDSFTRLGARCPRGVLLIGPPGTGKTLLARAVAGEANAHFHAASGADFVEMFVGMGARRVRELFAQARKQQPAIIFIDEIDAVGRRRTGQSSGGQSEYEQTINQLLTEMDGFSGTESVVVIAATNRMDVLDPALLRPGRFDRHVHVDLPDREAREQILAVHARGKQFAPSVSLADLARETSGMSGADLENLLNEAALAAIRQKHELIERADLSYALERVAMGLGTVRRLSDDERRRVAVHELGHALVAVEYPLLGRVEKVSVVSRGAAGGFTRVSSDEDRRLFTRSLLEARLAFILGGMAAEALYCDEVSSGANSDLQIATSTATAMVCEFGMSDAVGPVYLDAGADRQVSEEARREIRELTARGLQCARAILKSYAPSIQPLVEQLLVEEVWDGDTFAALVTGLVRNPLLLPAPAAVPALPPARRTVRRGSGAGAASARHARRVRTAQG
jgi:cell division protease FtsH